MAPVLAVFWIKHKKFKINQKSFKHSCCVMLCDLISRKNNNHAKLQIFLKRVLTNDISCSKFHELHGKCQCYGHIHWIVCLNEPILCTHIRLYVANNVVEESFQLYSTKKSFSIFSVSKSWIFVKRLLIIRFKIVPQYFCKILYHILSTINQPVASKSFLASSRKKHKFMPIYEEPSRIWTTSASFFAPDFL